MLNYPKGPIFRQKLCNFGLQMKNKGYIILLSIVIMVFSWSCKRESESHFAIDMEEVRLIKASTTDSVSLQAVLHLDSIEGYDNLNSLTAEAWILVDDSTGCIISQKHANDPRQIASLTKIMTCLLAIEKDQMADSVYITDDVFIAKDSRVRLGDGYVMENLVYEMMMQSDNDAAYAIAKHLGGDTLTFCNMMNEKAAYLGMNNTHFANPNGMPNFQNCSTASDMMKLARYSMYDSAFAQIVGTASKDIPLIDKRHLPCKNTNVLLEHYDGCIGIKTGYTKLAGYCLASAAKRNDTTLFLILLNSKSMSSRFTESALLLDYGFNVMKAYHEHRK